MTKTQAISELLRQGETIEIIALEVGTTVACVRAIRHRLSGYISPKARDKKERMTREEKERIARMSVTPDRIPLSNGGFALISAEDFPLVSSFRWYAHQETGGKTYATANYKKSAGGDGRVIKMHRLIMGFPEMACDHRDGNGLNNQRSNLRLATAQQNGFNKHRKSTRTKYIGVYKYKRNGRWTGQVTRPDGKRISIGYHKTDYEAAIVRDHIASVLHGEFAKLNFPLPARAAEAA